MPRPSPRALITKSGLRRIRRVLILACIAHGYSQRMQVRDIAKAVGMSEVSVRVWAHEVGIRHPRWNKRPEPVAKPKEYEPAPITLAGPEWSWRAA